MPGRLSPAGAPLLGLALSVLTAACSNGGLVEPAATSPDDGAVAVTLKVMSFNVLYGAGHERRFDEHVGARFKGRDRLPELVAFLREADADVIAIQEAAGWDTGEPSVAAQIASELGMSYVLAPDAWDLHVVLFSKYLIVAAGYVSRFQGFNGVALRTTIGVTPEARVNVVAVHLNSMSSQTRACQVEALLDMTKELEGRTILLGDMNFRSNAPQAEILRDGGWQLVAVQPGWPIDQIWLDAAGGGWIKGGWWDALAAPEGISDHLPVGVDATFDAPKTGEDGSREPVTDPVALEYACPLP